MRNVTLSTKIGKCLPNSDDIDLLLKREVKIPISRMNKLAGTYW